MRMALDERERDLCCQDAPSFRQLLVKMSHVKSRGSYVRVRENKHVECVHTCTDMLSIEHNIIG